MTSESYYVLASPTTPRECFKSQISIAYLCRKKRAIPVASIQGDHLTNIGGKLNASNIKRRRNIEFLASVRSSWGNALCSTTTRHKASSIAGEGYTFHVVTSATNGIENMAKAEKHELRLYTQAHRQNVGSRVTSQFRASKISLAQITKWLFEAKEREREE